MLVYLQFIGQSVSQKGPGTSVTQTQAKLSIGLTPQYSIDNCS